MTRDDESESAEYVARRATCTLALIIRLAEAETRGNRGVTFPELDSEAWCKVETLLLETRADVKRLEEIAEKRAAPFRAGQKKDGRV